MCTTIILQAQASVGPPQCNNCLGIIAKVNQLTNKTYENLRRVFRNDFGAHACLRDAPEQPARLILRQRRPYIMIGFKDPTKTTIMYVQADKIDLARGDVLRNEPRRRPEDTCRRLLDQTGLAASQPANQTARHPETLRRRPETLAGVRKPPDLL